MSVSLRDRAVVRISAFVVALVAVALIAYAIGAATGPGGADSPPGHGGHSAAESAAVGGLEELI